MITFESLNTQAAWLVMANERPRDEYPVIWIIIQY
jgi:hypothetical protein